MGGEEHDAALWHLFELLYKDRTLGLEAFYNFEIVNDRATDIDGGAMNSERIENCVYRTPDTGAKTPRSGKQDTYSVSLVVSEQVGLQS